MYTQRHYYIIFSLKVLTYPLILGNMKSNGLITSSKYPFRYLGLLFVSINFVTTILSISPSKFLLVFLHHKIPFLLLLSY